MSIIHLQETHSTNDYLKELLLKEGVEEGTIVVADYQSAGKGQKGNGWESARGQNLLFSMVIYPHTIKANEQFIISQFVSLAIKDFLSEHAQGITIKWPNDIYWQDKKICGILIENTLLGDSTKQSIIGVGININQEIFESNAPNPVSLKQIRGKEYDLQILLKKLIARIKLYYFNVKQENTSPIIDKYKESLYRKDGYHLYNDGTIDFLARIKDIESNGVLVLERENGIINKYAFKEVKYKL